MNKAGSAIDGFLKSPFSGLAPWILLAVVAGSGRFELGVCIALGVSVLTMLLIALRRLKIHALDFFGGAVFAALAVVGLLAKANQIRWLEVWAGELVNISLVLFVIATLFVRKPFTLPYAKEEAPRELWDSPLFLRINYVISSVWAAAFAFTSSVGFIGIAVLKDVADFWTGWVLQLAAIFFAVAFTEFYPGHAVAKAALAAGERPDEPAPSRVKLVDWLPSFVLVAGIFGWATGAVEDVVGIGMIVAGIAGSALIGKLAPATDSNV
jgi:putative Ca2+/H+ antiporter (TMEM165/GDT1 family)